ncbi:PLP-dependent transferase [Cystobasidium minutum MCA 4210]|uniref:PLP-dependent transferase n=1 Tax=Cystobasidium minutum MCA 4210 TaxID=1397322 RepID=UPI0034CE0B75|eukprot:jgi/Rhomi1/207515/estExt_Genemark1.C_1_t10429
MASSSDKKPLDIASLLIHADTLEDEEIPVGVPISTSTTFRHPKPSSAATPGFTEQKKGELYNDKPEGYTGTEGDDAPPYDPQHPDRHIYSRYTQPVMTRTEKVLSAALNGHAIMFTTGLSSILAALLLYQPEVVAIAEGYHGTHCTLDLYTRTREGVKIIHTDDDFAPYKDKRVLCWLETPVNPKGICRDIAKYEKKTRALPHGKLAIDSTFAPPPLQDPFEFGADLVMHSGTKYFNGHSDALLGVLATKSKEEWLKLWEIRTYAGMVPGSLESWLVLRSLRTLNLRVTRQSATATAFATWLNEVATNAPDAGQSYDGCPGGILKTVWHAALQGLDGVTGDGFNPLAGSAVGDEKHIKKPQMTGGPACFGILTTKKEYATWLPHKLNLMVPATSLGGVESLIEHRIISDVGADPCLIRLSIGLEDLEDLKEDFRNAFKALLTSGEKRPSKL